MGIDNDSSANKKGPNHEAVLHAVNSKVGTAWCPASHTTSQCQFAAQAGSWTVRVFQLCEYQAYGANSDANTVVVG
jgi:hypothetical protein